MTTCNLLKICISLAACCVQTAVAEQSLTLKRSPGWVYYWRIDHPCTIKNVGTKVAMCYIVNPKTKKWEQVWPEKGTWRDTWMKDYIHLEDDGDSMDALIVLKPIAFAFCQEIVTGPNGQIDLVVERIPDFAIRYRRFPTIGMIPDNNLQPRTQQ
jgi:hypothetical protein